jgi:hypothetical protein
MQVQKTIVFNVEFNSFEDTKKIRFLKFCEENNFFVEIKEDCKNCVVKVRNRFEEGLLEFIREDLGG